MSRLRGVSFDFSDIVILHKSVVFKRMFDRKVMVIRYDRLVSAYDHPRSQVHWYYDVSARAETVVIHPAWDCYSPWFEGR